MSDKTRRRWYESFQQCFRLSDKQRSERTFLHDDGKVQVILEQNLFLIRSEVAKGLDLGQQTISDHIRKLELCLILKTDRAFS